jgi:hypothetical protein
LGGSKQSEKLSDLLDHFMTVEDMIQTAFNNEVLKRKLYHALVTQERLLDRATTLSAEIAKDMGCERPGDLLFVVFSSFGHQQNIQRDGITAEYAQGEYHALEYLVLSVTPERLGRMEPAAKISCGTALSTSIILG